MFAPRSSTTNEYQGTNVIKLFNQVRLGREGRELEQHKLYLQGSDSYEVDNVPFLDRVRKAIYSPFETTFSWFVLD